MCHKFQPTSSLCYLMLNIINKRQENAVKKYIKPLIFINLQ